MNYDTPEEAARGSRASADVFALEESPDGRYAVAIVDKGRPGSPYPLQVICERYDDGWRSGYDTNGHGYTALPQPLEPDSEGEYTGVVTCWGEAPQGARSVMIRWRDRLHEVQVREGYYLFVSWHVPEHDADTLPRLA